jgi:hypothetical protein
MPQLVVGPLLRYVDADSATIWVETDAPCQVRVDAGDVQSSAATFCVSGHHYAIVALGGLAGASPYTVELDGNQVWPIDNGWPASIIRPYETGSELRVVFGSCRAAAPLDDDEWGIDALHALAERMRHQPRSDWPDLLAFVGDQVYADDNLSPETRKYIASHRGPDEGAGHEVANVDEYTFLYAESWRPGPIQWLLANLPSVMIFDDHDIRDDWNTSQTWRQQMHETSWWHERITSGLLTYWLYQHLGNLSPAELETDPLLHALRSAEGDGEPLLREHASRADAVADGAPGIRWSFRRDYGPVRLIVLDSRCNRVVDGKQRLMVSDPEWDWFVQQCTGDVDHLLIATSLPYLLPPGIHGIEALDEAIAEGQWGARAAGLGEKVRQGADLEHWAAFKESFNRMRTLIGEVARGDKGRPPATITFLSGDVHFSYLAEAHLDGCSGGTRILQAVCSPIRNPLPAKMRVAERVASSGFGRAVGTFLAKRAHASTPDLQWKVTHGPAFGNSLAELTVRGPDLDLSVSAARPGPVLEESWAAHMENRR